MEDAPSHHHAGRAACQTINQSVDCEGVVWWGGSGYGYLGPKDCGKECSKPATLRNRGTPLSRFCLRSAQQPILTIMLARCAVKKPLGNRTGPSVRVIYIAISRGFVSFPCATWRGDPFISTLLPPGLERVWQVVSPSRGKSPHEAERKACQEDAKDFHDGDKFSLPSGKY